MSSKLILKSVLVVGILVISGISMGYYGQKTLAGNPRAELKIKSLPSKLPGHYEKHLANLTTRIVNIDSIPENEYEEVRLQGVIRINRLTGSSVQIDWKLPEDVTLISGNSSEVIENPEVFKEYYYDIIVSGFNKTTAKQISLLAFMNDGKVKLGSSAIINSRPEDSLEYVAPQMMSQLEQVKAEYQSK